MKKLCAVLLALLFVVSVVSCKNEPPSSPTASTIPSSSDISSSGSDEQSSSAPSSSAPSSSAPSSSEETSSEESSNEASSGSSSAEVSSDTPSTPGTPTTPTTPTTPVKPLDHTKHYCYPKLTKVQQQYYNAMHSAVMDMHSSWIVLGPLSDTYLADIALVRQALVDDHPELFWLPNHYVTAKGKDNSGNPAALLMFSVSGESSSSYLVSRSEKAYMEKELNDAVAAILSKVTATDPFEKEVQLMRLLCEKVTYTTDPADPMIYSAYGALVNGRALCEGYSRAMQILLLQSGIPCTTVTGIANGEGHMWNLVQLGSNWYNLDATWNDTANGFVSFEYFNLTDTEIALDHTFSKDFSEINPDKLSNVSFNIYRPACTATEYNYFAKRGFVYSAENTADLVSYITASTDEALEVKFASQAFKQQFASNSNTFLQDINTRLAAVTPALPYYIGRYSVSTHTLKLYKVEK